MGIPYLKKDGISNFRLSCLNRIKNKPSLRGAFAEGIGNEAICWRCSSIPSLNTIRKIINGLGSVADSLLRCPTFSGTPRNDVINTISI